MKVYEYDRTAYSLEGIRKVHRADVLREIWLTYADGTGETFRILDGDSPQDEYNKIIRLLRGE